MMLFSFTPWEAERITNRFGDNFYVRMEKDLAAYTARWQLKELRLLHSFSANCVFVCRSDRFGDAVLKMGPPSREGLTEIQALREYRGSRFCRLFDADESSGVLLEERIHPGRRLREEDSLERRLDVFAGLYEGLHIKPDKPAAYPAYGEWVARIAGYMQERSDYRELARHMQRADELCRSLCLAYSRIMLLHGDLHHDNILQDSSGSYRIIDPKGVTGDPIWDIPRFILNEYDESVTADTHTRIKRIIDFLSARLAIPQTVIRQCLYVETAMAQCWNVESGEAPSMDHMALAEALLKA